MLSSVTRKRKRFCPCGRSLTKQYYSPESVARMLDCSIEKVRSMIKKREIGYKKIGRLIRIPSNEIDKTGQFFPKLFEKL